MDETAPAATRGHVVLCGLNELGYRTLEELVRLGEDVVAVVLLGMDGRLLVLLAWAVPGSLLSLGIARSSASGGRRQSVTGRGRPPLAAARRAEGRRRWLDLTLISALHGSPSLQDLRQDQHNDAPQETVVNRSIPLACGPKVDQDRFTCATVMHSDDVPPSPAGCPYSGLLRQGSIAGHTGYGRSRLRLGRRAVNDGSHRGAPVYRGSLE